MRIGIDAINIRAGGGVTHLIELLSACNPNDFGISEITVWATSATRKRLPARPWLKVPQIQEIDGSGVARELWRIRNIDREAHRSCDLLFVPGGLHVGRFQPFVTMSRNLLPFDLHERRRYGLSLGLRLRFSTLAALQTWTMRRAQGVIFLTAAAREVVTQQIGALKSPTVIISHGVSGRFRRKRSAPERSPSAEQPFRWLYVSDVRPYKHQWNVAEAIGILRAENHPVELHLVGGGGKSDLQRLQRVVDQVNQHERVVHQHGFISYDEIDQLYQSADGFVFASTCETIGNILLEGMASGLPVACSNKPVMQEILGDAGVYFDAENPEDIGHALRKIVTDHALRLRCIDAGEQRITQFSWERCARETFGFLAETHRRCTSAGNEALQDRRP